MGREVSVTYRGPTRSQVNAAGRKVRHWLNGEAKLDQEELFALFAVILHFRALHSVPLVKANMGLRSMVKTCGCEVEVTQRFKRWPSILTKLSRQPRMALATMQDIAGVRSVLNSIEEVRKVEQHLRKKRPLLDVADYITQPRDTGYRGVHVIVTYPDMNRQARAVEVQLRTKTMHEWAIAVERWGGKLQQDLKSGRGAPEVLDLFSAISEAMAIEEEGGTVGQDLLDRMRALRARAVPFLGERQA